MEMHNKMYILRDMRDLKQKDIAAILEVSQSNYSRWENNIEYIPLTKLNSLCNYYEVSMDYMFSFSEINNYKYKNELNRMEVGSNIKKFRKKYNITQIELANMLNTTQSTISAYESGKTMILTSFALFLVDKYGISLDELCNRQKN